MPLLNSSLGKIKAFFLSTNSAEDFALVASFARSTTAHVYFLYRKDEYNTEPTPDQINNLPDNVTIEQDDKHGIIPAPTTDRVISFTDVDGKLNLIFHKGFKSDALERLLSNYPDPKPQIHYQGPDEEFYITGGDTIVGSEFIIFGPQSVFVQKKYWQDDWSTYEKGFLDKYHYGDKQIKFLRLKEEGDFQRGMALYHLDFFLTYVGKGADGKETFVIGKIPKLMISSASNADELRKYQRYIDEVEEQLVTFFDGNVSFDYINLVPGYDPYSGWFWGFHTHNNVVTQISDKNDSILHIPYYNDASYPEYAELHAETVNVYSRYFDNVVNINLGKDILGSYKSSLHCFAAPLSRE